MSYDGAFVENDDNFGAITTQIVVTLIGDFFTQPSLTGKYSVSNVPNGMSYQLIRDISATQCTLSLTGNANLHNAAASINNLTLTFLDSAFLGGRAGLVENNGKVFSVTFRD